MITGGTGSFGNAVLRRFIDSDVAEIRVLSRDEKKQDDMRRRYKSQKLKFIIADIRDYPSVQNAVRGVDYIFHAAALKQVPSCEFYPLEAVKTNVLGTENVLEAAISSGVERVVCLSTDKAVYPASFMGITKRLCELYVSYYGKSKNINYNTVRFGNVIGSSGSVIPLFNDQILNGGPITITHNEMRRYFMTISEAAELIIQSSAVDGKGLIYILDMGKPVKIIDLAKKMIKLNGFTEKTDQNPLGDIEIKVIGIRNGEKLDEELFYQDKIMNTKHKKIKSCLEKTLLSDEIKKMVNGIIEVTNNRETFTKEKIVDVFNLYNKF